MDSVTRAVVEHVFRYRLTTPDIVSSCPSLPASDLDSATSLLETLVRHGWLQRGQLAPNQPDDAYYYLTTKAAQVLDVDPVLAKEPSREMRIESFAVAKFCCSSHPFRELFTKAEFIDKFGSLWYPGQPVRYYLEPTQNDVRLAFIKVDKGGASRWDRVVESCQRFLSKRIETSRADSQYHQQIYAYRQLVEAGRFQISLLTSLPEKCEAILRKLDMMEASGETRPPIVPHVVDGLFEMVHPKPALT